ncbi:MAG: GNAT family N-acetyltransferase [Parvibaculum sp.]|nr:GNAT family N-acetyltransferase [Parvibaculum sp.]
MEALLILQEGLLLDQLLYAAGLIGTATADERVEAPSPDIAVTTLRRPEAVEALAPEWRALEARAAASATAFQACDLHLVWARHFCDADTGLRVVTLRKNGRLVLVWPLAVSWRAFGCVATWAGDPIGQYGDVVVEAGPERDRWIEMAFREIGAWGDASFLHLCGVRADSAVARWAGSRGRKIGPTQEAPALDHSTFENAEVFAKAGWPQAKRNAKRIRKFESMGGMDFEMVEPGDKAQALVAAAFGFKRAWLDRQGHFGRAFIDARLEACLTELAGDASLRSGLVVSHLAVGGETAAIEVGFRHGGIHYAFMGAFSPDFAKHSPGFVVTELTIRSCVEAADVGEYDPLPPADDYKLAWSNRRVKVRDYGVVLDWPGYASWFYAAHLRPALKTLYARLPLKLRQGLRAGRG